MEVRRFIRERNSLPKRRLAYTLAAGAASVGVCNSAAEAAISYSGIQDIAIGQGQFQNLNLDGDLNTDVRLKNYVFGGGNYQGATAPFAPSKLVGFAANNWYYVSALSAGAPIDASTMGPSFYGSLSYGANNPNGQFNNIQNAYIGLDFRINNGPDLYYGWVRVSVNNAAGTFVIHDWAYQTEAGVGILAGNVGIVAPTGDFNQDGKVDAGDYVTWRKNSANASLPNDNGASTQPDRYSLWRQNFGNPSPGSGAALEASAIPEPMTLGLLATGAIGLSLLRRERRGRS